jgi:hypothetical protein
MGHGGDYGMVASFEISICIDPPLWIRWNFLTKNSVNDSELSTYLALYD